MTMRTVRLLTLAVTVLTVNFAWANSPVNTEDNATGLYNMEEAYNSTSAMTKAELREAMKAEKSALKAEKKQMRMEKRMSKLMKMMEKKMAKKGSVGGFDDPVDKWLWFSVISFGVAIIFAFVFWPISWIFWLGGIALLVVWIIKRFGD